MNHYYINCELGEGIPDYNFVIQAKDNEEARAEAWVIFEKDYPDYSMKQRQIQCAEVTADQLLERLTIN